MTPRRLAAIDIGTNSVLLTIVEQRDSALVPLLERATITRLGQGVDRARSLTPEAIDRTLRCLEQYRTELDAFDVTAPVVVGTSALRDAGGGAELRLRARELLGTEPRVLSGEEEAVLTFEGAAIGIDVSGELAVFDVGGGSTEIAFGNLDALRTALSLDVGSVRLFERHVRCDPPSPAELSAIDRELERALASAPVPPAGATLIGVAGTVTTLLSIERGIASYDADRVHGAVLERGAVERLATELATMTLAERSALPGLEPGRADVIVVGARIVRALVDWARAPRLVVSDRGVRWGLLRRLATGRAP